MTGIPNGDYTITIINPILYKAAAKYNAEKNLSKTQIKSDDKALTGSLSGLETLGRSSVKRNTPEDKNNKNNIQGESANDNRTEQLIKKAEEDAVKLYREQYNLDESVSDEEIKEMTAMKSHEETAEFIKNFGEEYQKAGGTSEECIQLFRDYYDFDETVPDDEIRQLIDNAVEEEKKKLKESLAPLIEEAIKNIKPISLEEFLAETQNIDAEETQENGTDEQEETKQDNF